MTKDKFGLPGERDLVDELTRHQISYGWSHPKRTQQVGAKPRADHRRRAQCAFRLRVEPIDTGGDRRLQRRRDAYLGDVRSGHIRFGLSAQHTAFGEFAHDFFGEERITGCPVGNRLSELAIRRVGPKQAGDQRGGVRITKRRKGNVGATGHPGRRTLVLGAVVTRTRRGSAESP